VFIHDDYWINIILPGRVPLLMSEWISMEDIDNLKGYDDLLWQRVHQELEPLMDPYGICTPPARLFYFTLLFGLFSGLSWGFWWEGRIYGLLDL